MNWIDIIDTDHKEAQSTEDGTQFRFRRKDGAWQLYTPKVIKAVEEISIEVEELVEESLELAEDEKIEEAPKPRKKRKSNKK